METIQEKFCKVCQLDKIIHGNDFCEACRSFYIRNQRRPFLPCKNNGKYKCLHAAFDVEQTDEKCCKSNRRLICPGCRLVMCKRVKSEKIRLGIIPDKQWIESVTSNDAIDSENMLKTVMKATAELSQLIGRFAFRNGDLQTGFYNNPTQAWHYYLNSMGPITQGMALFADNFNFHSDLDVNDRVKVMLTTKQRLIIGENMVNENDMYFGCMSSQFQKLVDVFLKPLKVEQRQAAITKSFVHDLGWNNQELAFLLAFLFFDGKVFSYF